MVPNLRPASLRAVSLWLLAASVAGCGSLAALERRAVYHPGVAPLPATPAAAEEIVTVTQDGLRLHGWLIRAPGGPEEAESRRLALYLHGNAGDRASRLGEAAAYAAAGCDTLLTDYRGYGGNPGVPSEAGLKGDARAWWAAALAEGYRPQSIAVVGNSLGGGVAVALAADLCDAGTPPGGMIVRSTFDSLTKIAAHHQPLLPVRWLMNDRFDSAAIAGQVTCPVLQSHGTADRVVPYDRGKRLHAAFPDASADGTTKRWIAVEDAGHNDLRRTAGHTWADAEQAFLRSLPVE